MDSMYRGSRRFDREQLIFITEAILCGAMNAVDDGLPDSLSWGQRLVITNNHPGLSGIEIGSLQSAGMSLGVLYAQLTGDGLGIHDALQCAGDFFHVCENLMDKAWAGEGEPIRKRFAKLKKGGESVSEIYNEVLGKDTYPDTRKHAETFVATCFGDYLK